MSDAWKITGQKVIEMALVVGACKALVEPFVWLAVPLGVAVWVTYDVLKRKEEPGYAPPVPTMPFYRPRGA